MPSDHRIKYDDNVRKAAGKLFEQGLGFEAAASALSIPPNTVRKWRYRFQQFGLEGLLHMGGKQARYTYKQKLAAVRAIVDDGQTLPDTMKTYGIVSKSPLDKWCKAYREGGAEALKPKRKGRPKGSRVKQKPKTHEQALEERVVELEAENAYLKKLVALRAKKNLQTGKRHQL